MKNYKLTNKDIYENFRHINIYLMINDFKASFAYWIVCQNPFGLNGVEKALIAYEKFLKQKFTEKDQVIKFTYEELEKYVSENIFCSIPEVFELNQTKGDFIDLGALARNMFCMIIREEIINN